ncbi:MAG: hypothetical protein P8Z75_00300 [Gammaproteobacteria bacterium]
MELRRFIFPALCLAVLAGVFLLGYQFSTFESEGLSPTRSLLAAIQSSPWRWGYALASGVMLLAFLIWVPSQFAEWRMLHRFRHIDSAVLDNDCELCQRFYHSLLELRRRYGETRFMQRIAGRFNFFYHYHTDALVWMNRIVSQVDSNALPANMIASSICAGHPGQVFCGLRYGGGLPSASVRRDEAVYLLAWMDRIEIWSASSSAPICVYERHTLRLVPEQNQMQHASVVLGGQEKNLQKWRQLELRVTNMTQADSEQSPQQQVAELENWLSNITQVYALQPQGNFGIDVDEITSTETDGSELGDHSPLLELLRKLLGSHIDAVFSHETLSIADHDITRSSIVLCSCLGIITVIDVAVAGIVHYSGESQWLHIDSHHRQMMDNACLTAQRSKNTLIDRLVNAGLNRWPVHGLVVFSHSEVQPKLELGRQQVQCDVITLAQLPKWFASQPADDRIRFTKDDYNEVITLLDPARLHSAQLRHA